MGNNTLDKHNYALDVLRIIACLCIVLAHISCYGVADTSLAAPKTIFSINDFQVYNFCSSISYYAVIIFIMISGSFLLDPNIELTKEKLNKHITKIVKLFLIFSLFDIVCEIVFKSYFDNYHFTFFELLDKFITGEGHLWYLYMVLGLYILTPILRKISSDDVALNEFIVIGFFVSVVIGSINILYPNTLLSSVVGKLHLDLVTGYSVYYLLGYKLRTISERHSEFNNIKAIIILSFIYLCSILATFYLTAYNKIINNNMQDSPYYSLFFIASALAAISLFCISLIINKKHRFINTKLIRKMSSYTTGIYCIHYYVISYLLKFNDFNFNAPLRVAIIFVLTILISSIGTFICKKIPFIKDVV